MTTDFRERLLEKLARDRIDTTSTLSRYLSELRKQLTVSRVNSVQATDTAGESDRNVDRP